MPAIEELISLYSVIIFISSLIIVSGGVFQRYGSAEWFIIENAQTICWAHAEPNASPWHYYCYAISQSTLVRFEVQWGWFRGSKKENGARCTRIRPDPLATHAIQDQQDHLRTQLKHAFAHHREWIGLKFTSNIENWRNLDEDWGLNMWTKLAKRESQVAHRTRTCSAEWELVQAFGGQKEAEISSSDVP